MHWVIQSNIFNEKRYQDVLETLERGNIPHTVVKVIPFSHDLEPKPEVENPIAVIGSYTLVRIAKKYGWGPGVFLNDNFDFAVWKEAYKGHLLNEDGIILPFKDVQLTAPTFLRPCEDTKDFVGAVVYPDDFHAWQELVLNCNGATLTGETLVCMAEPKNIISEFRFFVIDGEIVTGSQYKWRGQKHEDDVYPRFIREFAEQMVALWQPARGFVIDIAVTDDDIKVVEINNLNSSGFYMSDVSKLVQAIEGME
jgi:hypothetical protein